jgi:Ubiquitin-protein ligase
MKRVEEQFDAFMSGFNELIPPDLVNVFDERELELLIGGIADIDVEDWKKHTDYRGYQEQDEVIQNSGRSSAPGMRSRSPVFSSLLLVPRVSLSTDSRICRDPMVPDGLPLRSLVILLRCPSLTLGTYPMLVLVSGVS